LSAFETAAIFRAIAVGVDLFISREQIVRKAYLSVFLEVDEMLTEHEP
jgi:hypothetical protein